MSRPRPVPGGSPQGSILGNYLFCMTTNDLTQNIDYSRPAEISFEELPRDEDATMYEGELTTAGQLPSTGTVGRGVGLGAVGTVAGGDEGSVVDDPEEDAEELHFDDSALDDTKKSVSLECSKGENSTRTNLWRITLSHKLKLMK